MIVFWIAVALAVFSLAAVVAAVHFRAQAKTGKSVREDLNDVVRSTLETLHEELSGDLTAKVDGKFDALAKWLRAEFVKVRDAAIPAPAVIVPTGTESGPPPAPDVAVAAAAPPSVDDVLAQIDGEILAAQARRKKVEDARLEAAALLRQALS